MDDHRESPALVCSAERVDRAHLRHPERATKCPSVPPSGLGQRPSGVCPLGDGLQSANVVAGLENPLETSSNKGRPAAGLSSVGIRLDSPPFFIYFGWDLRTRYPYCARLRHTTLLRQALCSISPSRVIASTPIADGYSAPGRGFCHALDW